MAVVKKIAIIGNSGSGKSILATKLHEILNIPVYHLDKYFWKENWVRPNLDEYKTIHDRLCDLDSWIIDGMNLRFLEYRIAKSDITIFLDIPRYKCFWRIFKRTVKYYGYATPSSANNCIEKFDRRFFKFLKWVWNFKKKYPPKITELLNTYGKSKEILVIKSHKEIDELLERLNLLNQVK